MDRGPGEFCFVYYLREEYLLQLLREGRGTLVDWDLPFHLPGGPGRSTPIVWLAVQHLYPLIPLTSPQWEGLEMAEGWLAGLRPQWLPDISISSSCTLRNNVSLGMKKPSFVWPLNYHAVVPSQRVAGGCSSWAQPMPGSKACSLGTAWDSWSGSTAHLCPHPPTPKLGTRGGSRGPWMV